MFIRRLRIRGFRGIADLVWFTEPGVNCLVGRATQANRRSLLPLPSCFRRRRATRCPNTSTTGGASIDGFEIEAVLGAVDEEAVSTLRVPMFHGWKDGEVAGLPDEGGAESVLVARVSGSPELELTHSLLPPGGDEPRPFPVALRQRLVFSRVAGGPTAVRELRLGRGTLLDKHLGGADLRTQLQEVVAAASGNLTLPTDIDAAVAALRERFAAVGLPSDLGLGVITPQGTSLLSLVGLVSGEETATSIPLAFAGAGTRQMALFQISAAMSMSSPILTLDEPEVGLEPYRQKFLIRELRQLIGATGQSFITTHSPSVLEAMSAEEVWRLVPGENPISLRAPELANLFGRAPASFLSALPLICEGVTEVGLLPPLLNTKAARDGLGSMDALGVDLIDGKGNDNAVAEVQALLDIGMRCGTFVDAEKTGSGRRQRLEQNDGCAFGSWPGGEVKNIEDAVARWVTWDDLSALLELAAALQDRPVEHLLQQVGERAGRAGKASLDDLRSEVGEDAVRGALAETMSARSWFKKADRASELAQFLQGHGLPTQIDEVIEILWSEVKAALAR
jgi:putative ATP-dependent endonuclease of the OLD family